MGLNASTITNHEDSGRLLGFSGAMFVNLHISSFYDLQPEITYSNQGFKGGRYHYVNYYGDIILAKEENASIHYLELSLANKFFISPKTGLHFIVGPSLDINVSDNYNGEITPIYVGFFGGIGYELPIGLGFEDRYKQGFIDVREEYYEYYNGKNKLNSVFQFNVYYKFER